MSTMNTRTKKPASMARQPVNGATTTAELKPDAIRCRAYEIYLGRNGGPGDHVSDWIQAERELRTNCNGHDGDRNGVNAIAGGAKPTIGGETRLHGYGAAPDRRAKRGELGRP
ncbi:MAG: DUF2934 domain-containing protein [Phycisphaerales bacterium]|nr:DUF2934 domain-containing protein [Phycisphaerales bacterium]